MTNNPQMKIGVFTLAMISVSAIIALRNLPMMAIQGFSSLFFYTMAAVLFFIPASLVCAELSSGWPKEGGVYAWVREAFGERAGALAIWFEWIESVVWLPTVLSFIAATLAYVIKPELADNRTYLLCIMLGVLWSTTLLNFYDIRTSSLVSTIGIILGSIIPGVAIISLGIGWVLSGHASEIAFTLDALIPELTVTDYQQGFSFFNLKIDTLTYFTGILLGFAGIEIAAYHVKDTVNPQTTYPKATFISAITIITIYVLGALSIAMVVPKDQIKLHSGLMQAFSGFLHAFHMSWALPLIALLSVVGALALLNTWILGPSKGLLTSALNGNLPEWTKKTNRHGSPIAILLMQASFGSVLASFLLFMPTVSASYWILNVLAAQLILLMYLMIFVSGIWLRYKAPDQARAFKIPCGNFGMILVAGTGMCACVGAFLLGFVPPKEFDFGEHSNYSLLLMSGILTLSAPPFVIHFLKHQSTRKNQRLAVGT